MRPKYTAALTLALLSALSISSAHAQTAARPQADKASEAAHESREGVDNRMSEAHRERLHAELSAAQASGNKAKVAQIQQELAADYSHLKREKTEEGADAARDKRLKADQPHR